MGEITKDGPLPITKQRQVVLSALLGLAYTYAVFDVMSQISSTGKGFDSKMTKEHTDITLSKIFEEESGAIKLLIEH